MSAFVSLGPCSCKSIIPCPSSSPIGIVLLKPHSMVDDEKILFFQNNRHVCYLFIVKNPKHHNINRLVQATYINSKCIHKAIGPFFARSQACDTLTLCMTSSASTFKICSLFNRHKKRNNSMQIKSLTFLKA
jgi:hypothetical protein